jgi:hypothetical protein
MPTIEEIRAKMAQLQGSNDTSKHQLWKADPGNYVIRCLPVPANKQGEGTPFCERWFYYINGMPSLLQPRQFDLPDPIYELQQKLWEGDADDRVLAKKFFAKLRTFSPIIVKEGKGADIDKPLWWSFGKQIHQRLLGFFVDEEIGDILDLENGFDIKVAITKQDKKQVDGRTFNDMTLDVARRPSPALPKGKSVQEILDKVPDIDEVYSLKSYDEIDAILQKWMKATPEEREKPAGNNRSNGTSRGGAGAGTKGGGKDSLASLADEVAGKKAGAKPKEEKAAEKPAVKKESAPPASAKPAAAAKKEEDEAEPSSQSLDDAFDHLMDD